MSGIVGIWNLDGKPVDQSQLARMSATLAHRGANGERLWIQGSVGLACQLFRVTPESATEIQPLIHSSGVALVFDGRLDNRAELLESLKTSAGVSVTSPDPALVLAAYEAFGDQLPERLAGDFALGLFDPNQRRLLLARDAIGIRPLHYCRTGDTFLFASEIKALLAHPLVSTRPNDDVLAEIVLNSALQQNQSQTCFESIFSLPPAFNAILTPQGFVTRRYWDFDPARQLRLKSFPEYAEAFREHFERAVRRRIRSAYPVAVSVSGGLDSSAIFCLAETLRRRAPGLHPTLLGFSNIYANDTPADEQAFLREIERDYGIMIERLPVTQTGFVSGAREEVWHVETPFLDSQWRTTRTLLDATRQAGARVLLTGHWGDQMLFDQSYLFDLFRRFAWDEVRAHLREYSHWNPDVDSAIFKRRFLLGLIRELVPARLALPLRRLRGWMSRERQINLAYAAAFRGRVRRSIPPQLSSRATAHARAIYNEARSSYHVLCMEWNNKVAAMHGMEKAFPFLDRDLIAFLMSIPGEMQTWQGMHKALLREVMHGVLPIPIVERRGKADFTALGNAGTEREYPQLLQCIEEDGMAARSGYVKGDVAKKELARLQSIVTGDNSLLAWSLCDLLGLELWLQVFFNFQPSEKESIGSWKIRTSMKQISKSI